MMGNRQIQQFPNLVYSEEALDKWTRNPDICQNAQRKIVEAFTYLNAYGTDYNYLGKRITNTKRDGIWELKIKGKSKMEWRFLFKHVAGSEYAILHFFLKKDEAIRKQDMDTAARIAAREGW
ncbi:type II toxin-antitoxin system RelE/ParE family toxin [Paenibacillus arenosi]|uniref:Type II toxin-antitoxin system RelE/ParE family toxin n=1 Tax=Paenibacillus arenosi TaxID=2774142 RepID=A0ABR9AVJ5_9BACL|nr:type II toxin-antitoxin system RelE/ParE family toxin [Paenibacillus arenosi]MBD8497891.1 type II toxin-antitoxin system RelE/ParE family toxin [Paenibacillus arenosi]